MVLILIYVTYIQLSMVIYTLSKMYLNPDWTGEYKTKSTSGAPVQCLYNYGWQTDDNNREYAYCGDWEVKETKIKNMRNFVEQVHNVGMKFMLWYSVPFVGKYTNA